MSNVSGVFCELNKSRNAREGSLHGTKGQWALIVRRVTGFEPSYGQAFPKILLKPSHYAVHSEGFSSYFRVYWIISFDGVGFVWLRIGFGGL